MHSWDSIYGPGREIDKPARHSDLYPTRRGRRAETMAAIAHFSSGPESVAARSALTEDGGAGREPRLPWCSGT
ncbi:hypothetical protein BHE74_00030520 [Ensete ventricosum]|uniref:Uncharacterized protein n=1 Tax=Ensete ventricosum TaxID=4639 RepID=A0A445MHA9_ENSVE|nr:hypothetical protein BHE74_00030520 [Ensete ventricosum]RZR73629.1 hypothetical protein BHM03_00026533 [Ensete ventricosum]